MIEGVEALLASLAPIGLDADGGWTRRGLTAVDAQLRAWFAARCAERGLTVRTDRAGNQWAWWDPGRVGGAGVATGSHLDSVPCGGAFDGPLGVCSALAALDVLSASGFVPARPVGLVTFMEEEGSRFGTACLGSRLMTGTVEARRAGSLRDRDGIDLDRAWREAGMPGQPGADPAAAARVGCFVELHVEQGIGLRDLGAPVGVASTIHPHGRWRVELRGRANHAGTTPLSLRADPMLDLARLILDVRTAAAAHGAVGTVGRVLVTPNGANAIPSRVEAWVDVRAPAEEQVRAVVAAVSWARPRPESWTPALVFDPDLGAVLARVAGRAADPTGGPAPLLATGAGHDAGILSLAGIPSGMLFVRNTTGVSHAPTEHVEAADCRAGVAALAAVLAELASTPVARGVPGPRARAGSHLHDAPEGTAP